VTRLLHTSDWHLGRTLHQVDLLEVQRRILADIAAIVADPPDAIPVDAMVIAGDVYDRAVPPVEAVSALSAALAELTTMTTVIVTGGNHDSAIRLGFGSALFADRLQIRTTLETLGEPVLVDDVAIYPVPYLDPDVARHQLSRDGEPLARSHEAVMTAAMDLVRADLALRAGVSSVVVAHAFVVGGQSSDSERSIEIGGVDSVPASVFDGIDYVALGHLHRPQTITSPSGTMLRYSGSPLRYSLTEMHQTKSVCLIDLEPGRPPAVQTIELRQPRDMAEIRGELSTLLADPALERYIDTWLRVVVTDRSRPDELFTRVRSRFPHALHVLHEPEGTLQTTSPSGGPSRELRPNELATEFISYVSGVEADAREIEMFIQAWSSASTEESTA